MATNDLHPQATASAQGAAAAALNRPQAATAAATDLDRKLAYAVTLLPLAGTVAAFVLWIAGYPPGWPALTMFVLLYLATALGLEVGFHRFVTHRAFKAGPIVRLLLIGMGSMAAHGPVIWWAAIHRRHHATSDTPNDPHSPHQSGGGIGGLVRGLYHSHVGWLFVGHSTRPPGWQRYVGDLYKDPGLLRLHMQYYVWVLIGIVLPTAVCGALTGTWMGALQGFLWGALVRSFAVSQCIWALNSFCHVIGGRYFDTGVNDKSKNSFLLSLFTFGQGWHNNHHAFPNSAYTGLRWWQVDFGGMFVHLLRVLGLITEVNRPSLDAIARKRVS